MPDQTLINAAENLRRFQESLIPAFEEIAETFLAGAPGNASDLQTYLDSSVRVHGIRYRRRTILLAIHDMKHEHTAPQTLQKETLAYLMLLNVRPIPPLNSYRDIATALLRMEIVIRLGAPLVGEESSIARPDWSHPGPDIKGSLPSA
jgi:hypothetical protein